MINDVTQRFIKAVEHLTKIGTVSSPSDLAKKVGISSSMMTEITKGRSNIGVAALQNIVSIFGVSGDWLLIEKGNMLDSAPDQPMQITNLQPSATTVAQQSIPVYDLQMGSQCANLFDGGLTPINYISLPNLPKCDGAMVLYGGDTMTPALETGDILVYRRVKDIRKGLFIGHMYIVTFELEGEEYLLVRRIEQSEDKDSLKLVSNRVSQDILFDSIKGMAMVKASIRRYDL